MKHDDFNPDWASAPGDTIGDMLAERGLSTIQFAAAMDCDVKNVESLLEGRSTITLDVARKLGRAIGGSVEFWMSRDFQYREDVSRIGTTHRDWLSSLPISDMIKFGWLQSAPHPTKEVEACLEFFGVPTVQAWHEKYAKVVQMAAFRSSPSFESRPAAVAAWLRQGEIEGEQQRGASWSPEAFKSMLPQVRALTRQKDPRRFIPELQQLSAQAGAAVVIVRSPSGCRASGATRVLPDGRLLIQLSFRYLTDDQFWFTFFHESGHALFHANKGLFVDGIGEAASIEEREADNFAETTLVPTPWNKELLSLRPDTTSIIRFARKVGVSRGIIVGQLQHAGRIPRNRLNGLKVRFRWDDQG